MEDGCVEDDDFTTVLHRAAPGDENRSSPSAIMKSGSIVTSDPSIPMDGTAIQPQMQVSVTVSPSTNSISISTSEVDSNLCVIQDTFLHTSLPESKTDAEFQTPSNRRSKSREPGVEDDETLESKSSVRASSVTSVTSQRSFSPVESSAGLSEVMEEVDSVNVDHTGRRIDEQGNYISDVEDNSNMVDSATKDCSTNKGEAEKNSDVKIAELSTETVKDTCPDNASQDTVRTQDSNTTITVVIDDKDHETDQTVEKTETGENSAQVSSEVEMAQDNVEKSKDETDNVENDEKSDNVENEEKSDNVDNQGETCQKKRMKRVFEPRDKLLRTSKQKAEEITAQQAQQYRRAPMIKSIFCLTKEKAELVELCKPVSLRLYDVAPYLNGKTTVCIKRRKGFPPKGLRELLLIADNKPPVTKTPTRRVHQVQDQLEDDNLTRLRPRGATKYTESDSDCEEINVVDDTPEEQAKDTPVDPAKGTKREITVISALSQQGRYVYTLAKSQTKYGEKDREGFVKSFGKLVVRSQSKDDKIEENMARTVCMYNAQNIDLEIAKIEATEPEPVEGNVTLMTCSLCHIRNVRLDHGSREHQGTDPSHKCHFCGIAFTTYLARNIHSTIHVPPMNARTTVHCPLCPMKDKVTFRGAKCAQDLILHCHAKHSEGPRYACPLCPETFVVKTLLNIHIDNHKPLQTNCECKQKYCHGCTSKSVIPKSVMLTNNTVGCRSHMRECQMCQLMFSSVANHLSEHHLSREYHKQFRCSVCGVAFTDDKVARLHMRIHESPRPDPPKYMTCTKCSLATQTLGEHMTTVHKGKRIIACRYCQVTVEDESMLYLHERCHLPAECKCGKDACKMCSRKKQLTPEKQHLTLDEFLDTSEKTECPVCKIRFIDMRNYDKRSYLFPCGFVDLQTHIASAHESRSIVRCSMCKAGFAHRAMATFHLHVHTGLELPVGKTCSLCKETPESDMKSHVIDTHTAIPEKKLYRCTVCRLKYPEENLYRAHLLSHLPPKPASNHNEEEVLCIRSAQFADTSEVGRKYEGENALSHVCQICYLCIENLEEHALEHRANKARFRCRVCKVTFHTEVLSSTHARIHCFKFPPLSLRCLICQQRFQNGDTLISHCLEKHPLDSSDWTKGSMCNICQAIFPEENSLQAHKSQHNPKYCRCGNKECKYCAYYTCTRCGEYFHPGLKAYYLQHASHCHQDPLDQVMKKRNLTNSDSQVIKIARVKPYQCSDQQSQSVTAANTARRATPSATKTVVVDSDSDEPVARGDSTNSTECVACGVQIKSGTIAEHFRRYHNKPVNVYSCKEKDCSYTAAESEHYLRHRLSHLTTNFFRCLFCTDHFSSWSNLVKHNYSFHFQTHHRCNVCAMFFSDVKLLLKHNTVHKWTTPRGIPCNFCCRSFSTWAEYRVHEKHHGSICHCGKLGCKRCHKFSCACGSVFKAHQFLQYMLHMRGCFKCYACEYMGEDQKDLEQHELKHSVKCAVCGVLRKSQRQLDAHMTLHNCHCPADTTDCLFCKKAWCATCSQRFMKSELSTYTEHQETCEGSKLLCICREDDCIICKNAKCPFCPRMFRKHHFTIFSDHVKSCMGDSPDPFAPPTPKQTIVIKDEPIDLEYTRKRKVVDSTVIDLDSDSELEKDEDTNISGTELRSSPFPSEMDEQLIDLDDDASVLSGPGQPGQDETSLMLEADHTEYFRNQAEQAVNPWDSFSTDTPAPTQQGRSTESPQPGTSYSYHERYDSPMDSSYGQGVINIAPVDDNLGPDGRDLVPQPHGVINICPEGDFDEPPIADANRMEGNPMEQFVIQPVANINPQFSFQLPDSENGSMNS